MKDAQRVISRSTNKSINDTVLGQVLVTTGRTSRSRFYSRLLMHLRFVFVTKCHHISNVTENEEPDNPAPLLGYSKHVEAAEFASGRARHKVLVWHVQVHPMGEVLERRGGHKVREGDE